MRFLIPGPPLAKARQRVRMTKIGGQAKPWQYDPQEKQKQSVMWQLKKQLNDYLSSENISNVANAHNLTKEGFYTVTLSFHLPIPKSDTTAQRNAKLWGLEIPTAKDVDNLIKFILDCGNKVLYPDDRYIVSAPHNKYFSDNPRTEIDVVMKERINLPKSSKDIMLQFSPVEMIRLKGDIESLCFSLDRTATYISPGDTIDGILEMTNALSTFCQLYSKKFSKIAKIAEMENKDAA